MRRNRVSDTRLLANRNCLGRTCGTNIDTEGVQFTNQQPNLVYIDKVFSYNQDTASPILFNLNTGGPNAHNFTTELTLDGCSLFPCTLSGNAVFEIDNSFVAVEYFNTRPPGNIDPCQVTLDGFPVDSVSFSNGQYTAVTTNVLPRVQKERCLDRNLPTKAFFLINNAGPWDLRATYVLEGTVNTNGRTCRFRLQISNTSNSPNTILPSCGLSSFAVPRLSLPCAINGTAPNILFQFNAKVNLVNPRLFVTCGPIRPDNGCGCCEPPFIGPTACPDTFNVNLVSTVSVEPVMHVETIRKTLFCVNACEGLLPCDGSIAAAEEEDDDECEVDRPACRCGSGGNVGGVSTCCNRVGGTTRNVDVLGCGGFQVGGLTVGTGTCEDCKWSDAPQNCRSCSRPGGRVAGTSDRTCRERLLEEIRDELLSERDDCDFDDDEVLGAEDRRERTAFQYNGCNGCSW